MFNSELEKEAKRVIKKFGKIRSLETIGYKEWFPYYPNFKMTDKEKIKEDIILHTIQLSKQQKTWLKKDKRIMQCC